MRNKYQEALDELASWGKLGTHWIEDDEDEDREYKKVKAHKQTLQELVDKATQPNDFDEAMKFHRMALQEHLGAIAKLQETFTCNELGPIHYALSKEIVEEYLNTECECAVEQVIEDLHSYIDWS